MHCKLTWTFSTLTKVNQVWNKTLEHDVEEVMSKFMLFWWTLFTKNQVHCCVACSLKYPITKQNAPFQGSSKVNYHSKFIKGHLVVIWISGPTLKLKRDDPVPVDTWLMFNSRITVRKSRPAAQASWFWKYIFRVNITPPMHIENAKSNRLVTIMLFRGVDYVIIYSTSDYEIREN